MLYFMTLDTNGEIERLLFDYHLIIFSVLAGEAGTQVWGKKERYATGLVWG